MESETMNALISELREPCPHENCVLCHRAADTLEEYGKTIQQLREERAVLDAEAQLYRDAARLYGIDAKTMLTLAKSQIKTCADNIRLVEKMGNVLDMFKWVPSGLTTDDVCRAITHYDGDGSKPYCDLVYCGLDIIRTYLKVRSDLDEWRKANLPFSQ